MRIYFDWIEASENEQIYLSCDLPNDLPNDYF